MNTFADVLFEMQLRTDSLQAEAQEERWSRLAAAGRSQAKRDLSMRRMAVRLGDYVSGLRCLLQSRFAADTAPTAC
jgi:hypothetical protein